MPNRAVAPTIRDRLLVLNHGATLTTRKREAQQEVSGKEAFSLPWRHFPVRYGRWARLRRLAWVLETAVEIGRYAEEFEQVILLSDRHEGEPAQQHELPTVLH